MLYLMRKVKKKKKKEKKRKIRRIKTQMNLYKKSLTKMNFYKI